MKFSSKLALVAAASLISVAAFAEAPADLAVDTMKDVIAADMAIDLGASGAYIKQTADATTSTALIIQDNASAGNYAYINQVGDAATAMINQAGTGNVAMIMQK